MSRAVRQGRGRGRAGLGPAVAVLALVAIGCGGPRNYKNDNDALRALRIEQEKKIAQLEAERDELEAKLAEANRAREEMIPEEVLAAMPRVASVEVESVRAAPRDGGTMVSVLVATRDGRRRFVQAVGTLRVELVALHDELGDTAPAPERIGVVELDPVALREAYRSGIGGLGYEARFEIPGRSLSRDDLVARVELVDALTGTVHTDKRISAAE